MDIKQVIQEFRENWIKNQEKECLESRARESRRELRGKYITESILPNLSPATADDYAVWLSGWLTNGGKLTHHYDYQLERGNFYIATKSFSMIPLYGAASLQVIVPEGLHVHVPPNLDLGHSTLYLMDTYKLRGIEFIPLFNDIVI